MRIVEPLSDAQRDALLSHPASPAYVSDAEARKRIVFTCGNVLRSLTDAMRPRYGDTSEPLVGLPTRLHFFRQWMEIDCADWLGALPAAERSAIAAAPMALLLGERSWTAAAGLYDAGIVYRTQRSDSLWPVSSAASAAYLQAIAAHVCTAQPWDTFSRDDRWRDGEFQRLVLAHVTNVRRLVASHELDGSLSTALFLHNRLALPFDGLGDVVQRDVPVLYRPLSPARYTFDGIIVPGAGAEARADLPWTAEDEYDTDGAIVVLDCSATDPRNPERLEKVRRYFEPEGVVGRLRLRFPTLHIVVALVYDGELAVQQLTPDAAALSRGKPLGRTHRAAAPRVIKVMLAAPTSSAPKADRAKVYVRVIDRKGMERPTLV